MGTAIIRPQDRPKLRYMPLSSPPMNPRRNPSRRKRSPTDIHVSGGSKVDRSVVVKFPAKDLVMGKVTILKRGEDLKVVDLKVVDIKVEDLKIEDLKIEDLKIEDLTVEDLKVQTRRLGEVAKDRKVRFEREDDLVLCSTEPLGPEPEMVQKQITLNVPKPIAVKEFNAIDMSYASPEPSSVPFPLFFSKNLAATCDLRRLLHLDLF